MTRPKGREATAVSADATGCPTDRRTLDDRVLLDRVPAAWPERVARALAPLVDAAGASTTIPGTCSLAALLGLTDATAEDVSVRWAAASDGLPATVGVNAEGPVTLDLTADGPHALVAGTTGAGKSEFLRTLIASCAVDHPPESVTFLLIDYKGGAAFGECAALPHSIGLVTDLDPLLTERALRSLNCELSRRERLLAEVGATDLAEYRAKAAAPLPRIVIVVDEFATLADELPGFLRGLIGVAQRGRSLGVHLVLATQRPGNAVSPEIRANTALRVCLRVTDAAESVDVVGSPLAARIDRRLPGRAYIGTGMAAECVQTAYAGGVSSSGRRIEVRVLDSWRQSPRGIDAAGEPDLSRLVAAVVDAARITGRPSAAPLWQPPLPSALTRTAAGSPAARTSVRVAAVDLPDDARLDWIDVDPTAGEGLLVSGTAGSGRTSALAALAVTAAGQLSPAELEICVVDPIGDLRRCLEPLPHVVTTLGPDDISSLAPLLRLLRRRSSTSFRDRGAPTTSLLVIDGWDRILSALPDLETGSLTDQLADLLRGGASARLAVAVSGDRSTLLPRLAHGFVHRLLLRQADRADYGLAGVSARRVPHELPPGRGFRVSDGALVQVAMAGDSPAEIAAVAAGVAQRWAGTPAPDPDRCAVLRPLPELVPLAGLPAGPPFVLGVAGDRAAPLRVDLFAGAARLLVAGPPRSGRTTLLMSLGRQAGTSSIRTVVAAPARSPLAAEARTAGHRLVLPDDPDPGDPPAGRTLLLVDDCESFTDRPSGDRLMEWLRATASLAAVVAGRADDLATSYRGIGAEARRCRRGVLLRPGPVDGDLLGVRLPRRSPVGPPGRGVIVGDSHLAREFAHLGADDPAMAVQVALP